jgi:nicotinamide-nucleotide amidase
MNTCILSIGNELLNGHTTDTNSAWLCGKLLEKGIAVRGVWLVPDEHNRIVQSLEQAAAWSDLIIVTGGLGPTDDDITRQAVADYLGVPLEFKQELLDQIQVLFTSRGWPMAEKNRVQAFIPQGADVLHNPVGTAPGFWCQKGYQNIAVMPGVPSEMKRMFEAHILTRLAAFKPKNVVVNAKVRCFGAGESSIAQRLGDLMQRDRNPLINCTCGAGDIVLHISATAQTPEQACQMIKADKNLLIHLLGDLIYGYDDESLAALAGQLLTKKSKKIAIAESCTGGLLLEMLTDVPGASDYLLAGWVTYSNDAKIAHLEVPRELIVQNGAVSEPVARAMAIGAARKSGAEIAVGITGVAGPGGGTDLKPVGLVYISVYVDGNCDVYEFRFSPVSRKMVRLRAALTALNLLRLKLQV